MPKVDVIAVEPKTAGDSIRLLFSEDSSPAGISEKEFDRSGLSRVILREGSARTICVGLGEREGIQARKISQAVGLGTKELLKIGAETVVVDLTSLSDYIEDAVIGALLAAYKFEDFKSPDSRRKNQLKRLAVKVGAPALSKATHRAKQGVAVAEGVNLTRQLGNLPPNVLTPATLAGKAREMARSNKLTCRIWDERRLRKEGFGGILAVGGGSVNKPRMMVLEYWGGGKREAPVALVGKAMTFDSGGLSIKPAKGMEEMKWDKMGGCTVIGIMQAVAALKLPISVVAVVASAENMLGEAAYRPSDIVTTYDGKTIEILNTDAEGRVILADALSYARKTYKPRCLIDFATLTGACVVALGSQRAGLFTEDEDLLTLLSECAESSGDRVWSLPMGEEFADAVRSDVATAKNAGDRMGGASFAASFLSLWAEDTPFAHIDIAGTAWTTKELPHLEKGASGHGVRLVVDALRRLCDKA